MRRICTDIIEEMKAIYPQRIFQLNCDDELRGDFRISLLSRNRPQIDRLTGRPAGVGQGIGGGLPGRPRPGAISLRRHLLSDA